MMLHEPIAIIGIGCRFPSAPDPHGFWKLLLDGRESVGPYPGNRFPELDTAYATGQTPSGRLASVRGGFLPNIDQFDAQFFSVSPREAQVLDPQQRLLMEVAWEAFEDAGQRREALAGTRTGVFVGIWINEYEDRLQRSGQPLDFYAITGGGRYPAAGRLSYYFGLEGPSLTVDTACSSSLVAAHLACQSLRSGESDMALAAGVNLIFGTEVTELFTSANMLSPDGRCKFGDASADGFVRSEGAAAVVLKTLSRAEADRDPIYALIRGSAVNNDGRSCGLMVAPSRAGQQMMLRAALQDARVPAHALRFIEAHGTGTAVGDPVEIEAIGAVMGSAERQKPCSIGSVKTNIGHTEGAAGLAGLIKAALALKNRILPASLNFEHPNPAIPWESLPVAVQGRAESLASEPFPIYAGVSSFGITGTNAHAIVEEVAELVPSAESRPVLLLPVSAHNEHALRAAVERLQSYLGDNPDCHLPDLCFTAAVRRTHHPHRAAFVFSSREELLEAMAAFLQQEDHRCVCTGVAQGSRSKTAWVFPGQGSQWQGMGVELYAAEPVFRTALDRCDAAIRAEAGWSVLDELRGAAGPEWLDGIDIIQPVLFAMSVALGELWKSWGIEPAAVVGHSMGEVAAAYMAGILTFEDAVKVICCRSKLMKTVRGRGLMAVAGIPAPDLAELLQRYPGVSIAAVNSSSSTVLSGDAGAVTALVAHLNARDVFSRLVKVDVASHSVHMDPLCEPLRELLSGLRPRPAAVPMYSTVTGEKVEGPELDRDYWARNLRHPVLFGSAVEQLRASGYDMFIEMSAHPILAGDIGQTGAAAVGSLRRESGELAEMLANFSRLYVSGCEIEWRRLYPAGRCLRLPAYPWQRERFWPDTTIASPKLSLAPRAGGRFSGTVFRSSIHQGAAFWETELSLEAFPYLGEHRVHGLAVLPAALQLQLAVQAAREALGPGEYALEGFEFERMIVIPEGSTVRLQVGFAEFGAGAHSVRISTAGTGDENWIGHSSGVVKHAGAVAAVMPDSAVDSITQEIDGTAHTSIWRRRGVDYGPAFSRVESISLGVRRCAARLRPESHTGTALDAAFQTLIHFSPGSERQAFLPAGVRSYRQFPGVDEAAESMVCISIPSGAPCDPDRYECDVAILSKDGSVFAQAQGVAMQRASSGAGLDSVFELSWQKMPDAGAADPEAGIACVAGPGLLSDRIAAAIQAGGGRIVDTIGGQTDLEPRCIVFAAADSVNDAAAFLKLVQDVIKTPWKQIPQVCVITTGAQAVLPGEDVSVDQAAVWGLGRVLMREHPELRCSCIDVSAEAREEELRAASRLIAQSVEQQLAIRGDTIFRAQLAAVADEKAAPAEIEISPRKQSCRVEVSEPGIIESARVRELPEQACGPGQVRIAIEAAGLNFIDVMKAMGIYPGLSPTAAAALGGEAAGRVREGGEAAGLRRGDAVLCITPSFETTSLLASETIVDSSFVRRMPANLTFEQAAAFPIVFMTAHYALNHLARVQPGECVLVHAAAGGVGLAAIQLVQRAGGVVIATAGTPDKRKYVQSLGVEHVFDSRSLDFAADVLRATAGRGVDVVLNSLAGAFIPAGLRVLAPYGRFVEIGKRDIYDNRNIGLEPFRKNLSYFAVDLAAMVEQKPQLAATLFHEVMEALECGELRPLPVTAFPMDESADALRHLAQARHIGKVALTIPERPVRAIALEKEQPLFAAAGTHLITGGLGGVALEVAAWMVEHGVRHLMLAGRNAPSPRAEAAIALMKEMGARVETIQCDIALKQDVARMMRTIEERMPPLGGVWHAAAVTADALLADASAEELWHVMRPKLEGAWNLHHATQHLALDHFILFSSIAAILPQPGHGVYAAANAALDALAAYRRHRGLPAISINWGGWLDTGLAKAEGTIRSINAYDAEGIGSFEPAQALAALERILRRNPVQAAAVMIDTARAASGSYSLLRPSAPGRPSAATAAQQPDKPAFVEELMSAAAGAQRRNLLEGRVCEELARVLRTAPARIDRYRPVGQMGLDSLMAIEFVKRVSAATGVLMAPTAVFNYPTVAAFSGQIAAKLGVRLDELEQAPGPAPAANAAAAAAVAGIEHMSDADVVAVLMRESREVQ